jgi:hypothetical protein
VEADGSVERCSSGSTVAGGASVRGDGAATNGAPGLARVWG